MTPELKKFKSESERVAFDLKHRQTIKFNIGKYEAAVERGKTQYLNLDAAKDFVAGRKREALLNLDFYLKLFEENFIKNGGEVIWARNEEEAVNEIISILKTNEIQYVVKSKSMTTEEIHLNEHLAKNNIEPIETDLGEFIVQVAGEKPYHIITPVMHKSKEDIADLFNKKFDTPPNATPEELTLWVRNYLREKFYNVSAGITGANFIVADIGAIALTENEGNGVMSMSFPKIHIAIAGIEKVIPSIKDLHHTWPLLATLGTGQRITAYNSLVSGPKKHHETDGPEKMFVVLLDNGRTRLLDQNPQFDALRCIRCGACLNACPVYRNIGGYTYNATYSGPIGKVISPHLLGFEKNYHLSFASSLCRSCSETCPVKIDLAHLILHNRNKAVKEGLTPKQEKKVFRYWKKGMLNKKLIRIFPSGIKNWGMNLFATKLWGKKRAFPKFPKRTFEKTYSKTSG